MSPSPVTGHDQEEVKRYGASWQAIMKLVRSGSSWSGYERNCCFLNTEGRFAGASHVSGLDFVDDGRGMAVTDWDQDGDLDLWFRNRTAPRLRLMLNQASTGSPHRFVAFRLTGTKSNRDAIGAVVELQVEGSEQRLVRSVRAGDLFLSQSSKWVHFGLPENAVVKGVKVLWPGGERSTYGNIEAGNRYVLVQGEVSAKLVGVQRAVTLKTAPLPTKSKSTAQASIVLPAPVRVPIFRYRDETGREVALASARAPRLLVLWSAGCPHCQRELAQFAQKPAEFDLLALCVDGQSDEARQAARAAVATAGYAGRWGMIGADAVERVHLLQEALFDSTPQFAVPISLLLSADNDIVAIYRGALSAAVVAHDRKTAAGASHAVLRNLAPPFPGRWFTLPAGPAFLPNLIARRIQERYPEDSLFYLRLAADNSTGVEKENLMTELGRRHFSFAREYDSNGLSQKAHYHFAKSLAAVPNNAAVHNDFGSSLARRGQVEEGAKHFAEALRLRPDFALAKENLVKARRLLDQQAK